MKKIEIIAEIGWNHMGNMVLAKKMILQAKKSGADTCKFQTWSEKNLKPGPWDKDGRREIYKKAELTLEKHILLKKYCKKVGVKFLSSVFSLKDLQLLHKAKVKEIKIPSHEIYNIQLIKEASKKFNKVYVSAGASNWNEIIKIKKTIKKRNLILMHCVSSYPCYIDRINLLKLNKLKKLFFNVGYSGHLSGIDDAVAAICSGAKVVEKHFTINNNLPGRDNKFAILPAELKKLSQFRDNYEKMIIDRGLNLQNCEKDIYRKYRGRWSKRI
mgnify:CR=1 FL=1|tara:strand:+ start:932 stop:1744 length:813 start_codon:yes stop_codon:yes gene_type:complete